MEKNILKAFQPNIVERLGEVYWRMVTGRLLRRRKNLQNV